MNNTWKQAVEMYKMSKEGNCPHEWEFYKEFSLVTEELCPKCGIHRLDE